MFFVDEVDACGNMATLGFFFECAFGALPAGAFRHRPTAIRQFS